MENLEIKDLVPVDEPVGGFPVDPQLIKPKDLVDPKLIKPGKINDKELFVRLYSAGLTHDEIASFFGVSREAVTRMAGRMDLVRESANPALFQEKMQEEMLIRMEAMLNYMSPEKMSKASLSQLIMAFGILYDKVRLQRGESTQNVAAVNIHKLEPETLNIFRDLIAKRTQDKLKTVRKQYEE
jgi:transposase